MKLLHVAALAAMIPLVACTTTNETPIAPNVVRLDTSAQGLLFTGHAGDDTLKKAAETTIAHGYQYFRFADVTTGSGSQFGGVITSGSANAYGGAGYASVYGQSISTPIYSPTAKVGATVIMSNKNGPGEWNAADVLAQAKVK
jgi:hypothetical protein